MNSVLHKRHFFCSACNMSWAFAKINHKCFCGGQLLCLSLLAVVLLQSGASLQTGTGVFPCEVAVSILPLRVSKMKELHAFVGWEVVISDMLYPAGQQSLLY
eukprot:gb/GEZJ01006856.1/.p1 GENE.gb/GEZJ01006856.1/~~gb/GEZJ01006856.1/.p1  ORF type:complete len:102 (+),score=6.98 gb/GEZJ01006856.1/:530-835(+)